MHASKDTTSLHMLYRVKKCCGISEHALKREHVASKKKKKNYAERTHTRARAPGVIRERISRSNNRRLTRAWLRRAPGADALALPPPLTFTPALLALARSHPAERAILPTTHTQKKRWTESRRITRKKNEKNNKLQTPWLAR